MSRFVERRDEPPRHAGLGHVILSEAKDLVLRWPGTLQAILRFAQDDMIF